MMIHLRFGRQAGLLLLALFAVAASGRLAAAPFSCTVQHAGLLSMRMEGNYEQPGGPLLTCTGGTPVSGAAPIVQMKLGLDERSTLTSRILDPANKITEVLAIIDEPYNGPRVICQTPAAPASCPGANYFPGIQTGTNELTFSFPLAPPGDGRFRQIRVSNLRVQFFSWPPELAVFDEYYRIRAAISGNGSPTITHDGIVPGSGFVEIGHPQLSTSATLKNYGWGACGAAFAPSSYSFAARFAEISFPHAWRTRTRAASSTTSPAPGAQDVPGIFYLTESGLYTPSLPGIYQTAGLAEFGTRFYVRVANVPAGVKLLTPEAVTVKGAGLAAGSTTGAARRVLADATGAGPYAAATGDSAGLVEMTAQDGGFVAVYEVLATDTNAFEELEIPVWTKFPNGYYVPMVGLTFEAGLAPWKTATSLQRFNTPAAGTSPEPVRSSDCSTTNTSSVLAPPPSSAGLSFVPVKPCRLVDTREDRPGGLGKPAMVGGVPRSFALPSAAGCGLPASARAYSLNFTVVPTGPLGYLTAWPTGAQQPFVSTLNSIDGRVKANAAIVPAGTSGAISAMATDATELVVDVNGYFVDSAPNPQALAFYPIPPCRIADTRNATGSLGGPVIGAGGTRSFPVLAAANCGVPGGASAYSLNATVVPKGPLGYLTLWPTGDQQPLVSTLNSPKGEIVANAAIVPAGTNGAVSAFAQGETHLVLDINGYFAPPGGLGALRFFGISPCRLLDTRSALPNLFQLRTGGAPAPEANLFPTAANCGVSPSAKAYALNVTVPVNPAANLGYLTMWPTGQQQPFVSTLNANTDKVVANAAIVPAGIFGGINVFATDYVQVVLDVNGFFAP